MLRSLALTMLLASTVGALAQTSVPANQVSPLKDTTSLKPPAGAKVAIIEYEDLECPYCAKAFPIIHAAAKHYNLALDECDFQISYHHWSHDAALCAHYLKAKVSPVLAEEYRREVFASQARIGSRDDLQNFTRAFFDRNGQHMPFVVDPARQFDKEIAASTEQARKIGINETPSIFVVTADHWIQVKDVDQLDQAIEQAEAEVKQKTAHGKVHPHA